MEGNELVSVLVNGKELEILDYDDNFIFTEGSLSELEDAQTTDFPDNLIISS